MRLSDRRRWFSPRCQPPQWWAFPLQLLLSLVVLAVSLLGPETWVTATPWGLESLVIVGFFLTVLLLGPGMSLPLFWLMVGAVLCLMELFLPTAFVEATLGVSALLVAAIALVIPQFGAQVGIWLVLSVLTTWGLKRFVPKHTPYVLADSTEARTLTAIAPGQTGRVLYEGNSWQARCEDFDAAIGADEPVIVVGRKGNTLLIMPERSLR